LTEKFIAKEVRTSVIEEKSSCIAVVLHLCGPLKAFANSVCF